MISLARPLISDEEKNEVKKVLDSGILAQGEKVKNFEEDFANYCGVKYGIAVNSGTAALHLALIANKISKGDEVITTPFSFIATVNTIKMAGAKPVFVDINEDTFNIDETKIEEVITDKTKAIMPVHLYGNPCNMKEIMNLANNYDLKVIEDACQAHGAMYNDSKVGSFGTGTFSFYPTKNMTTGEGGIITTNDPDINEMCRKLRQHGMAQRYSYECLGYNYRMTDIGAAIGVIQLKKLDFWKEKRIENANLLSSLLKDVNGIITPKVDSSTKHVFHQYTIRVTNSFGKTRDEVINLLNDAGIGNAIFYPRPLYYYSHVGFNGKLEVTEKVCNEVISLPIHPNLSEDDLHRIAE